MKNMTFNSTPNIVSTYKRGSDQIDTILASANILPHVIKQYMLSYDSVCLSDHRAMYIDIHLHKLST